MVPPIPAGDRTCFDIDITNDTLVEGDETFFISISSPDSNVVIGGSSFKEITILDNDCEMNHY